VLVTFGDTWILDASVEEWEQDGRSKGGHFGTDYYCGDEGGIVGNSLNGILVAERSAIWSSTDGSSEAYIEGSSNYGNISCDDTVVCEDVQNELVEEGIIGIRNVKTVVGNCHGETAVCQDGGIVASQDHSEELDQMEEKVVVCGSVGGKVESRDRCSCLGTVEVSNEFW